MYKNLFTLSLLSIILSVSCKKNSTGPEPEGPWGWAKQFDGGYSTILYSVQQTNDGGFITVGRNGNPSVWLIKTDNNGDTLWTRIFNGYDPNGSSCGYSVRQTTDGGFIVVGSADDRQGGSGVFLLKTDSNGDTLWTKTYGGPSDEIGYSVRLTMDGGFIIAGFTESYGAGNQDVYLIKTDAEGNAIWSETYGDAGLNYGKSVASTTDGGYIVVGRTHAPKESYVLYMIKTDSEGDTIWTKTYAGVEGNYVVQTTDGGYIVVGNTEYQAGDSDAWLLKTDSLGDTLWVKTYGGSGYDLGYSVQQTTDGGYIITGESRSYGTSGTGDVWLIKTDTVGITQWTWTFNTQDSNDRGMEVQQTAEGDFIVAGFIEFGGSRAKGILIRKY